MDRERTIEVFSLLGEKLSGFGQDAESAGTIRKACEDNPWFTPESISYSMEAIRREMLSYDKLKEWSDSYSFAGSPKKIGVIMAGNIPLVGFFDMMCVLVSGHSCYIKPSSKDKALTEFIRSTLKEIDPGISLHHYKSQEIDAVIATGSNNTNRYFRSTFGDTPSVLRGNRYSAGILTGRETDSELDGLANDIFMYSGLGCRNVCRLFLPNGYDIDRLVKHLSAYKNINPKFINNLRQRLAVLKMQGESIIEGPHFVLWENAGLPAAISEITYSYYPDISNILEWLKDNDRVIQCVVCDTGRLEQLPQRAVPFGKAQSPGLTDYPDDIDIMKFLSEL